MVKLSRAEKNEIILNDSRGFPHPEYYVYTTKSGQIQVRKRKISLSQMSVPNNNTDANTAVDNETNTNDTKLKEESLYETMTNKMILEKMLNILEKNAVSNDKNLSPPENESITNENKEFVDNIVQRLNPQSEINDNTISQSEIGEQQYVEEVPRYQQPVRPISYWKRAPRKLVL